MSEQRLALASIIIVQFLTINALQNVHNGATEVVSEPATEFRGLFLTTSSNLDWPSSRTEGVAKQQKELLNYLNMMNRTNMNTLVFQIRPAGDAFYQSTIEPWSKYLTGTQGTAPSPLWDPLEFAVQEAHQRNIQVHAWLNPYLANQRPDWNGLAPNHMANRMPQFAHPYGQFLWMDPGAKPVADQLINVIKDILTRYLVDGILFDDFFYPYPSGKTPFPDNSTWNDYVSSGGKLSRDDWRRDNVNRLIHQVKVTVASLRPRCLFGISPFGLYRPGERGGMPAPTRGFDPYSGTYADSKLWLQKGWVDYLSPQLYWAVDSPGQSYPRLLDWWLEQNIANKTIYVANAVYRVQNEWPVSEVVEQVVISRDEGRRDRRSLGNIHFSAKSFRDNTKNITEIFRDRVYTHPAIVPSLK